MGVISASPGDQVQVDRQMGEQMTSLGGCTSAGDQTDLKPQGQLGVVWELFSTHQVVRFQRTEGQGHETEGVPALLTESGIFRPKLPTKMAVSSKRHLVKGNS